MQHGVEWPPIQPDGAAAEHGFIPQEAMGSGDWLCLRVARRLRAGYRDCQPTITYRDDDPAEGRTGGEGTPQETAQSSSRLALRSHLARFAPSKVGEEEYQLRRTPQGRDLFRPRWKGRRKCGWMLAWVLVALQ